MKYTEVYKNIYSIEVSLPNSPLRSINIYLIKGKDRNLLIDTGFNSPICHKDLLDAFTDLQVDLKQTDFFITHLHTDHCGLIATLSNYEGAQVYCGKVDGDIINRCLNNNFLYGILFDLVQYGFPEPDINTLFAEHPGRIYAPERPIDFMYVADGDTLSVGEYTFTVVHTPGHTPGHMTLFDTTTGVYFCADHIINSISPNISHFEGQLDPLGDYLQSLDLSASLKPSLSLPAHREVIHDTVQRVEEIKHHHELRLTETLSALSSHGSSDAFLLSSHLTWSVKANSWYNFSLLQQWFATGETLAHLERLEVLGKVGRTVEKDGRVLFYCK